MVNRREKREASQRSGGGGGGGGGGRRPWCVWGEGGEDVVADRGM